MLYIALGILGATVMPHNLYLHSSIVQTRKYGDSDEDRASAIRFATLDSTVALSSALFINAAILIVAAATFHGTGYEHIAEIKDAYVMLTPLLGTTPGQHAVRARAALRRSERDDHGHARRPDRDGGVPEPPPAAVAAPADHAAHRHRAGGHRHRVVRRAGHRAAADPEPGDPQPAAAVRGVPARCSSRPTARRWDDSPCRSGCARSPGRWRS